ncbi:Leukocyte immunoglobulin-like receptor subfamily A member 1 [Cricetulus griseus]|nr:Leukocyte immunoglobulin-like receptor subfamily A member 1 [Cricetulus griseus]
MERHHAGKYRCYSYGSAGWTKHSDPLELVVTGIYSSKLTLSALPSLVVTPAWNVTLQCRSQQAYDRFILMKDDQIFSSAASLKNIHHGLSGARFRVGPGTPNQRWMFTCYGHYLSNSQVWSVSSNDLQLLVSGNLQKPSMWAQPGSVVSSGSSVTIWCAGPIQALTYVIHKEGSPEASHIETQVDHNNNAKFSIPSVSSLNAGRYNCYSYSSAGWTEHSDILELVVTGVHDGKPTLSALPSPVVTSGVNVTLQCMSSKEYDGFILTGADLKFPRSQKAQFTNQTKFYALFPEISVTYSKNGPFRCYGYYTNSQYVWSEASNPLEIHVSGTISKSTLRAVPSNVVAAGEQVTFLCEVPLAAKEYGLYKEGSQDYLIPTDILETEKKATFSISSVQWYNAGQYWCKYNSTKGTTKSTDILELVVTGLSRKPYLVTQQGTVLAPGKNLTLKCFSETNDDRFALYKEGEHDLTQVSACQSQDGHFHAKFTVGYGNYFIGGRYRCLGAHSNSSEWSAPSDPLDILITGHPLVALNLSVHPGPTVSSGENVTLLCRSSGPVDTFFLFKEGESHPYMQQSSKSQDPQHEAKFSMSAVTPDLGGSFICFGSERSSPFLLSHSSVSVEIIVSGEVTQALLIIQGNPA